MRKLFLVFSFLLPTTASICFTQQADSVDTDQLLCSPERAVADSSSLTGIKPKKFKTGMELGTSFSYSPNNFCGPSYYVAPNLSYQINSRLSLSAGVAVGRSILYPLYPVEEEKINTLSATQLFMYARTSYLLSNRVMVHGEIYKSVNEMPKLSPYSTIGPFNYQGMRLGVDYKLTKTFSVGFQMDVRDGNYNGYNQNSLIPAAGYIPMPGF